MKKAIMSVLTVWILVNVGLFSLILLNSKLNFHVSAGTIIVDDNGTPGVDCNYTTIQEGIDAANPGDTVFVRNGTYYENVVVYKSLNLLGENIETTIIDGSGSEDVVYISADWVYVNGFTITGSGPLGRSGIKLYRVQNCTVINNNVTDNENGITLFESNENNITGNLAFSNLDYGFFADYSDRNDFTNNMAKMNRVGIIMSRSNNLNISHNTLSSNVDYGIYIGKSRGEQIINNTMIQNGIYINGDFLNEWNTHNIPTSNTINGKPVYYLKNQTSGDIPPGAGQVILANCSNISVINQEINNVSTGIALAYSSNIDIKGNQASSNTFFGISLYYSNMNNITNNNIISNLWWGINLEKSDGNYIFANSIIGNDWGILLHSSNGNNITKNKNISNNNVGISLGTTYWNNITYNDIYSNNQFGIYSGGSYENNIFHNNFLVNQIQAFDDTNNGNRWDNGYPSGGNFWSDYNGNDSFKGLNQDISGSDGIGDTNYSINSDSVDNYPLMNPIGNLTYLREGWNLISIPFIQPDTKLDSVLSSINDSFDAVQWFNTSDPSDPWKHHQISKPSHLNDLSDIEHTIGFWIHITNPGGVLFEYFGTQPTSNQSIPLHPGWNMVGYPSLTSRNRTAALNNLTFGLEVDVIWTFDASTQTWEEIKAGDYFEVGRGYWVHAAQECVWEVPL